MQSFYFQTPFIGAINPRKAVRLALAAIALVGSGAVPAQDFRDSFRSVTRENFDSGGAVSRQFHLNAESYRPAATISRVGGTRELPRALRDDVARATVGHRDGKSSFDVYVNADPLTDAVVILHGGRIVYEAYTQMQPWQRHFAWSVTKVVTSTALAALVEQGAVDMQTPVDRYLPQLKDSAWAGIPVQHLADMASGIDCLDSDGYQDKTTCVYAMEESLGITAPTGRDPDFMEQLKQMQMHGESGRSNEYVSANTNVLGLVIEAVTGQSYAAAVRDLLWRHLGAEGDALMTISEDGYAYASGGLQTRLRDLARFGQIYTDPESLQLLSPAMIAGIQSGGISLPQDDLSTMEEEGLAGDLPVRAAWQWDQIWSDGAMFKGGYGGQGIYVDPARDLVVAWFGTGINFDETINEMVPVTRQLVRAGLFDAGP